MTVKSGIRQHSRGSCVLRREFSARTHEALWDQSQKASAIQSLAAPILLALHGATKPAVIDVTNAIQSRERIQVAEFAAPCLLLNR